MRIVVLIVMIAQAAWAAEGMVKFAADGSVAEVAARLTRSFTSYNLRMYAHLHQQRESKKVGVDIPDIRYLMIGNQQLEAKLLICSETIGLDLPLKLLIKDDGTGTQIMYTSQQFLKNRHKINGCTQELDEMYGAIENVTQLVRPVKPVKK